MIVIDGYQWPVPCKIDRVARVEPSNISGLMLDKTYFNDVLGTYLEYSVVLAIPTNMVDQYATLYESLTSPVDGHTFIMPYNDSTIEITARVGEVKDAWVYTPMAKQFWRGVTFTAISNHPSKYEELGEVMVRGRKPIPEGVMPNNLDVGTYAVLSVGGWIVVSLPNGDEMRF